VLQRCGGSPSRSYVAGKIRCMPSVQGHESVATARRRWVLDVFATVVLSAATVLTAWAAFEGAKWSGEQATDFSGASASRTESVRESTAAGQYQLEDTSLFIAWLTATDQGQSRLAGLVAERFRPEFRTAFQRWEAMSPLTNPSAPLTPFELPGYELATSKKAADLEAVASRQFEAATEDNQRADDYVLMTVLFAISLFFGAVSARTSDLRVQAYLVGLATVVFITATVVTATFPIEL
jgi:hypothetical protein